jgi:hypothetical protein
MTYAEFETPSGFRVLVDQRSDDVGYEASTRAPDEGGIRSHMSLPSAIDDVISTVASTFLAPVRQLPERPDELSVEFGIRLHYRAGAIVPMDNEGAHFKVMLLWSRRTDPHEAGKEGP